MTALTQVPDPRPDYATTSEVWARQHMNAAAARLDAQLREIAASRVEHLIEVEDLYALTIEACETYAAALGHPIVVAAGVGGDGC